MKYSVVNALTDPFHLHSFICIGVMRQFNYVFLGASSGTPLSLHSRQMRTAETAAPGPTMTDAITSQSAIKTACLALFANQTVPNRLEPIVNTASHCKNTCVAN